MVQSKYWCFTSFDVDNFDVLCELCDTHCSYYVIGKERCGETGRAHLQGYLEFSAKKRLSTVKSLLRLPTGHFETRKGTARDAADYCKKGLQAHTEWTRSKTNGPNFGHESDFREGGEISVSNQGKRTDIDVIRDSIRDGSVTNSKHLLEMCSSEQAFKFGSRYLATQYVSPFRRRPDVYWLFGSTGSGKSMRAYTFVEHLHEKRGWNYWGSKGLQWFDGYIGQEIAVFDDFRFNGNTGDFARLLRITDRYRLDVPVKGGFVTWEPRVIIFTTCKSIDASFDSLAGAEGLEQLKRRIDLLEFNFNQPQEIQRFEGLIDRHCVQTEDD